MSGSTNKQEDEHHQQQQQQPDGGDTRDNIDSLAEPGVHDQAGNRAQGDPSNGRHASLDPGQAAAAAWEEQRRRWLTPKNSGRGLTSSTSNLARLNRISNPSSDLERSAADRAITIIKNRLTDGHQLKEAMPLRLLVALLYRSWFIDGTITPEMVAEAQGHTATATVTASKLKPE